MNPEFLKEAHKKGLEKGFVAGTLFGVFITAFFMYATASKMPTIFVGVGVVAITFFVHRFVSNLEERS